MRFRFFSQEELADQQNEIVALLKSTGRKGIDNVLDFLEDTHFYSLSDVSHHHWRGGLAQHSLGVYRQMSALNASQCKPYPEDTVILVAVLHDLCKAYFRRSPDSKVSISADALRHLNNPDIRLNHGRLSAVLARYQCGLELSDEEYAAIDKHMHYSRTSLLQQLVCKADRADCREIRRWTESRENLR